MTLYKTTRVFSWIAAGFLLLSASVVHAQTLPSAANLTTTLELSFENTQHLPRDFDSLRILKENNARFKHFIIVESLSESNSVVAEIALSYQGSTLRYPVKLARSERPNGQRHWQIQWVPSPSYTRALLNIVRSDHLPHAQNTQNWHEATRLPSLPVLVTRQQLFTPFGEILVSTSASSLEPPAALFRHVERWVNEILEDAPGPASIDVIADSRIMWSQFIGVLMGAANSGLFRINVVTKNTEKFEDLGVLSANLPVFGSSGIPEHIQMLTVAIYPLENAPESIGARLAFSSNILTRGDDCSHPDMTFCTNSLEEFAQKFNDLVRSTSSKRDESFSHLMLVAPESMNLNEFTRYWVVLANLLVMTPEKIFIGYVQQ